MKKMSLFVWDLPTRLFHWGLVTLVAIAWATGEEEGRLFILHQLAGYGVTIAILFRLIWGFAGSRYSRFLDFVRPWPVVRDHLERVAALSPERSIGHNPAGGWMIVLMIAMLSGLCVTGLFSSEDGVAGPLAGILSPQMEHMVTELHEGMWDVFLFMIFFHMAGVLVESMLTRDNLTRAMWTGRKEVPMENVAKIEYATAMGNIAPHWRAAVALATATGVTWLVVVP